MYCAVDGCNKLAGAKNLCKTHYERQRRNGDFELRRRALGTGSYDAKGYKIITIKGEKFKEHILIAEKALGRKLRGTECVHHMNEKKADNHTPFNLVICPDQAYHSLLHKRARELGVKW